MGQAGVDAALRVLVVVNSYPSVAAPSGATYVTNRLRALRGRGDVEVVAVALVPTYTPVARAARRLLWYADEAGLALAPGAVDVGLREARVRWSLLDVVAGRLGWRPAAAIRRAERAVAAVLADLPVVGDVGGRGPGAPRTGSSAPAVGARGWRPDVVHAHGMYTLPAGEVARRLCAGGGATGTPATPTPYVVSLHGSDVTDVMARRPGPAAVTLGGAAATVYVSRALRAAAVALGLPAGDGLVVPNGVDAALFGPYDRAVGTDAARGGEAARGGDAGRGEGEAAGADGAAAVGEGEAAGDGPRLLYVGNLLPVKGVDRLPAIVAAVRASAPGAHLDVLGDGELRPHLADALGAAATLHGRRPPAEVAERMRAADVLLVPSRSEGWGCVATEALAVGTPVVATAVGGLPEAVGDPRRLVAEGADFAGRFGAAVLAAAADGGIGAAPASLTWAEVVDREVAILCAAVARRPGSETGAWPGQRTAVEDRPGSEPDAGAGPRPDGAS